MADVPLLTPAGHAATDHTGITGVGGGGGIDSGTSFPVSPTTNDLFYRTDRALLYFYDGTRWLTVNQYVLAIATRVAQAAGGLAATTQLGNASSAEFDMFIEDFRVTAFASGGAFDATNRWEMTLEKRTAANAATTIGTLNLNSQTSNNWKVWTTAIDAVVDVSTHIVFHLAATKFSSAPNLFFGVDVTYRLVG